MATTNAVLRKRVERGATLLDAEQPGWCKRIDLVTLDMGDTEQCVLGQMYGHYSDGVDALGLGLREYAGVYTKASTHGFDHDHAFPGETDDQYPRLLPLWREAIEARC